MALVLGLGHLKRSYEHFWVFGYYRHFEKELAAFGSRSWKYLGVKSREFGAFACCLKSWAFASSYYQNRDIISKSPVNGIVPSVTYSDAYAPL